MYKQGLLLNVFFKGTATNVGVGSDKVTGVQNGFNFQENFSFFECHLSFNLPQSQKHEFLLLYVRKITLDQFSLNQNYVEIMQP